jgi:hypothetical protein
VSASPRYFIGWWMRRRSFMGCTRKQIRDCSPRATCTPLPAFTRRFRSAATHAWTTANVSSIEAMTPSALRSPSVLLTNVCRPSTRTENLWTVCTSTLARDPNPTFALSNVLQMVCERYYKQRVYLMVDDLTVSTCGLGDSTYRNGTVIAHLLKRR